MTLTVGQQGTHEPLLYVNFLRLLGITRVQAVILCFSGMWWPVCVLIISKLTRASLAGLAIAVVARTVYDNKTLAYQDPSDSDDLVHQLSQF